MAIEPININVLPTGTEITLDEPSGNGIRLSRLSVVGNPYRLLDGGQVNQDITEWSFDTLATAADPVSVNVTYSCTLTISAVAKAQFDAGEILFTPTSAAWHPDQDDGSSNFFIPDFIFDASVAGSISENSGDLATWSRVSGDGTVQSGGLTLGPATTHPIQTTPTYDGINKVVDLPSVGDGNAGPLEFSSGAQNVRSLALVISIGSSSGASPIAPSNSSDFAQWTPNGSGKLTDIFDGQYFDIQSAWDGEIKGTAGNEVIEFESAVAGDIWYRNEQAGSQSRPAIDQVFIAILREPGNNIPWQFIGARWNSQWQRTGPMKVHCVLGWPDYINDDYALLLQQWLCWKAFNEGWTPTLLLPDTGEGDLGLKHPHRDGPAGGAGVPSVNVTAPVLTLSRAISNATVGSSIAIFKRSRPLIADRSQFTLGSGNDSGSATLVVNQVIPADTPPSGYVRVLRDDLTEDRLQYSSWSGSTFTLAGTLPATYSSDNGCYVGYLDILGTVTGNESVNLQFVESRECVLLVSLGSGPDRMRPIRQDITLGSSDFEFQVSAVPDTNNNRA